MCLKLLHFSDASNNNGDGESPRNAVANRIKQDEIRRDGFKLHIVEQILEQDAVNLSNFFSHYNPIHSVRCCLQNTHINTRHKEHTSQVKIRRVSQSRCIHETIAWAPVAELRSGKGCCFSHFRANTVRRGCSGILLNVGKSAPVNLVHCSGPRGSPHLPRQS